MRFLLKQEVICYDIFLDICYRWSVLCRRQIMFDVFKLSPAHTLTTLVVTGAVFDGLGLYEPLINFAGAGATVPITSFGNSLVHGAMAEAEEHGLIGVITGMFEITSSGISAAIIFGVIGAIFFKSKG